MMFSDSNKPKKEGFDMAMAHPDLPSMNHAVLVFMIGLALIFFIQAIFKITNTLVMQLIIDYGIMVGVPLWISQRFQFNLKETFFLEKPGPRGWGAVLLGWIGIFVLLSVGEEYLIQISVFQPGEEGMESFRSFIQDIGAYGSVVTFFVLVITPAFCEEFLFRGFFLRSVSQSVHPVFAIVGTALLFAVLHPLKIQLVLMTVFGLFLGTVAWGGKSILITMGIHFLHNSTAIYVDHFNVGKGAEFSFRETFGLPGSLLLAAGALVLMGVSYVLARQDRRYRKKPRATESHDELYGSVHGP